MNDAPLLLWHNLIEGATHTVNAGTEYPGAPAANMANGDTLRPCQIEADASGVIEVAFDAPAGYGYGSMPFGFGPYGGAWNIEAIVLGANRHQSAGFRTPGLTWTISGHQVLDIWPTSSAVVIPLDTPITPGATITVRIEGASANQLVTIPELYVGPALTMPHLDLGFDPYNEVTSAGAFKTESGREYLSIRYRRLELAPKWSVVPSSLWADLDFVREDVLEARRTFWFAWAPQSRPTEVYLVRHAQSSAPMPIKSAIHRSLGLTLVEAV